MNLEDRYIVIKRSEIEEYLTPDQKANLASICLTLNEARKNNKKGPLEALVLERDWPEYKPTLNLLSKRIQGSVNLK